MIAGIDLTTADAAMNPPTTVWLAVHEVTSGSWQTPWWWYVVSLLCGVLVLLGLTVAEENPRRVSRIRDALGALIGASVIALLIHADLGQTRTHPPVKHVEALAAHPADEPAPFPISKENP